MDDWAFASLAHIQILLVPVAGIVPSSFERYASLVRSFNSVRLEDIPADCKDEKARFMPNPMSPGHVHLNFSTHPPPRSHLPLSLIRPSHFPLAVIGIADSSTSIPISTIYHHFDSALIDVFPSEGVYPLAKNCFVFEGGDDSSAGQVPKFPGLIFIPNVMGNKKLYVGTLLADLCSQILGEFGVVVQALETSLGNEYLNAAILPTMPALSDLSSPFNGTKTDTLSMLPSNHHSEAGKVTLNPSAAALKSPLLSGPVFRQSSGSDERLSRKRLSSLGVASSHARLFKLLGDFFLLAGRPEDASIWYTESLVLFKLSQDFAWHASALEGIATVAVLEAWSAGNGLQGSTSSKESWSDISDKLAQATVLYSKSPTSEGEPSYSLLSYLFACSVLRHTSLLVAIWSAKGWSPLAFTMMLQPGQKLYQPPTHSQDDVCQWQHLEHLSSTSGISRSLIANVLAQVHGPWLLHLGPRERIGILEATSNFYASLGYRRKEAYILREVIGCIMDLIVCGREEDGLSKMSNNAETFALGLHGRDSSSLGFAWGGVGVRVREGVEGNDGILYLVKYVCKVLGINLEAVKLIDGISEPERTEIQEHDADAVEDIFEPHGWPELQVGVIREAVAVAEALPDFYAVAQFTLSALKTLQAVLSPGDQYHLFATSSRALATATRRGGNQTIEHWAGRPVLNIDLVSTPLTLLPVEKPMSALRPTVSDIAPILTGGKDPFLYNPRKVVTNQERSLVVVNEDIEFMVTLHNSYVFDLPLQSMSLSTSGVAFQCTPIQVIIPATSLHQVVLSGKALDTGILIIRGCIVQVPGGAPCEFVLPLSTPEEEARLSRKRSSLACELGRFKYSALDSFFRERKRTDAEPSGAAETSSKFLELKVIPQQPLLRIRRTSATHGAIMLYNGEKFALQITLENVSLLPVDFLRLSAEDSTVSPCQQALAEGYMSVFDIYETEHSLINQPVFTWDQEDARNIQPGQKLTVAVTCHGKPGCTNGTMYFSYSYIHRREAFPESSNDVFYARQLTYPIKVTVYDMLECHGMDILPFPSVASAKGNFIDVTGQRGGKLQVDSEGSWCLFSIEVRNAYGSSFDVSLERIQDDVPPARVTATIPQGSMSRIVIPIRKFSLSEKQILQPIPTLSDRQFVVRKAKLSEPETKTQRELFWYREHLLQCIHGHWRETGGTRFGELSLRQQRLSLAMVQNLRMDNAHVSMSLVPHSTSPEGSVSRSNGRFYPLVNEFVSLRIRVTNISPSPLVLLLDFEMEPSEQVIYEGILSGRPVGRLQSGEHREMDITFCFLAYGRFEIIADVKALELPGKKVTRAGTGQLTAVVKEARVS